MAMKHAAATPASFDALVRECPCYLAKLKACQLTPLFELRAFPKAGGVYVIFEGRKPLYTGRTRDIRRRLGNHRWGKPGVSAFAMKLTRQATGKKATYKKEGGFNSLRKDPDFLRAYELSANKIKGMSARYVEIENGNAQYLFELYAAMALKTPHNDFNTH